METAGRASATVLTCLVLLLGCSEHAGTPRGSLDDGGATEESEPEDAGSQPGDSGTSDGSVDDECAERMERAASARRAAELILQRDKPHLVPKEAPALLGESAESPDGSLLVTVGTVDGRLTYDVVRDGATSVVAPSDLGFRLRQPAIDLTSGMTITSVDRDTVDETWTPAWGTASRIRNHARQLTVHALHEASGVRMDLVFRVFDDGVGFRYHFPAQPGLGTQFVVAEESSEFRLPADMTAHYIAAGTDWNADEKHYQTVALPEVPTAQTPLATSRGDGLFVSVHEADLTDFPSMTLRRRDAVPGALVSELISLPSGDKAVVDLGAEGFDTPWRTLIVGRAAGDLAESHLIENLNDPCALCDTDRDNDGVDDTAGWIVPATYTGVWWELQRRATTWTAGPEHGATTARTRAYIDLAASAGAKFVLAEGWNMNAGGAWTNQDFTTPQADFDLAQVLSYAASKGVGFIAHNETRGYVDDYDQNLERIFSNYQSLGIHAIKTGYATRFILGGVNRSHYDQEAVRHYQRVIDAAARHQISINAHEAIKPTGLARTYPNMMTGEGVAGMEMQNYMGPSGNPPAQATILPFTRFMGGPADYTPGVVNVTWDPARLNTRVQTTSTAQLALYTTFFSPLTMLADTPENYALFPEAFAYLTNMPTTWDESEVRADIGDHVVTARRSGSTWYVGAITNENDRRLTIPLDFLEPCKPYVAEIYSDAADTTWRGNPMSMEVTRALVTSATDLVSSLVGGGGQALRIRPATREEQAEVPGYVAPSFAMVREPEVFFDPRTRSVTIDVALRNAGSTVGEAVFTVGDDSASSRVRVDGRQESMISLRLDADELPYPGTTTLSLGDGSSVDAESVQVDLLPVFTGEGRAVVEDLVDAGHLSAETAILATAYVDRAQGQVERGDFLGVQRAMQDLRLLADGSSLADVSDTAQRAIDDLTRPYLGEAHGVFTVLRALRRLEQSDELDPAALDALRTGTAAAATAAVNGRDQAARTELESVRSQSAELSGDGPALSAMRATLDGLLQADLRVEAEAGTLANGVSVTSEHPGYTGTGFVKGLTREGAAVTFRPVTAAGIDYELSFRYANGMLVAPLDRELSMTVNGVLGAKVAFANTGQDANRWRQWTMAPAGTLPLPAGANTVVLGWSGNDTGHVNVDHLLVRTSLGVLAE